MSQLSLFNLDSKQNANHKEKFMASSILRGKVNEEL